MVRVIKKDGWGFGDPSDKFYSNIKCPVEQSSPISIPAKSNLKETYYQVLTDVKQGDSINIEGLGTLYYAGVTKKNIIDYKGNQQISKTKTVYIYKNSLNNLKQPTKPGVFKGKTSTGYELYSYLYAIGYELDNDLKEEEVTGKLNTENKELKVNMVFSGTGTAKFGATEIKETDILYKKLENGYNDLTSKDKDYKYEKLNIYVFDTYVISGSYKGKLNITFNVGTEYNGKDYIVGHLKNGLDYEYFKGIVENGKVTITVDSLSPFMLSVVDKEKTNNQTTGTDKGEKDDTPKTGVTQTMYYILPITIISAIGVIALRKKQTK